MVDDFFRNRLDQIIDLHHPLAVLPTVCLGKRSRHPRPSAGPVRSRREIRLKTRTCLARFRR